MKRDQISRDSLRRAGGDSGPPGPPGPPGPTPVITPGYAIDIEGSPLAPIIAVKPEPDSFLCFCVDYDGTAGPQGNDLTGAPGYVLPTGVPATDRDNALALAKSTPYRTLQAVGEALPRYGNNATLFVLVAPRTSGATYKNIAGADQDMQPWCANLFGWKQITIRGSLDFANNSNDKIRCGFQTSTTGFSTNAAGYSAGATTTTSLLANILTAAGAAPGLPTESGGTSAILGKRIRFTATTPTAALRNFCTMIWEVVSATSVIPSTNLPAVPVFVAGGDPGNDIFVIEEPGVRLGAFGLSMGNANTAGQTGDNFSLAGFRFVTTPSHPIVHGSASYMFAGLETAGDFLDVEGADFVQYLKTYTDELTALVNVGVSLRSESSANGIGFLRCRVGQIRDGYVGGSVAFVNCLRAICDLGVVARRGVQAIPGGGSTLRTNFTAATLIGNNGSATSRKVRLTSTPQQPDGGIVVSSGGAKINGIDASNLGNNPIVAILGQCTGVSLDGVVSSHGGNTNVVLSVPDSSYALSVIVGEVDPITATATLGDIAMSKGEICTFASLATTNLRDTNDNNVTGGADTVVGNTMSLTNATGGATAIPIFNIVRSNGVTGQMVAAKADTIANSTGILGATINQAADTAAGLVCGQGPAWVQCDGAITPGATVYLSDVNAGQGKGTAPVGIAVAIGVCIAASGTLALVNLIPSPKVASQSLSLLDYAKARAAALVAPIRAGIWEDSFNVAPLQSQSFWNTNTANATTAQSQTHNGGVVIVTVGALGTGVIYNGTTPTVISNMVTSVPWYALVRMALTQPGDPSANTVFVGFGNTGLALIEPGLGFSGADSTTKYRFFDGGATGVNSSVSVDGNFHTFEMWGGLGDGKIYGSVDEETPVSYTPGNGNTAVTPFIKIIGTAGNPEVVSLDDFIVISNKN